jgi:deoxycytidine triphosphate deaminase
MNQIVLHSDRREEHDLGMSVLITGDQLREAVEKATFIQGGDVSCAEGVKYDLRLSPKILKAKFGQPIDLEQVPEADRSGLCVEPGEVVFVLTEERLALPSDMVAQLSPKRKLSHAGILTLGGFCIDPGYAGRLLIGLFNLSSSPWPLRPHKKLIGATFFRLQGSEVGEFPPAADPLDDFPDELVEVMQKYKPLSVQSVSDTVQRLQSDLLSLRGEIRNHEDWYKRFKDSLEAHNDQIGRLSKDLSAEADARKGGHDKLTEAVQSVKDTLTFLKGTAWFVMGVTGIGVALFVAWISKQLLP